MQNKSLVLRSLRFAYPTFELGPVDLEVPPGSVTALVGPNGAGKTTLLHCAAGLLPSSAGDVLFDDVSLNHLMRRRTLALGSVANTWYADLTVGENLRFVRRFYPSWSAPVEKELLRRFSLNVLQPAGTLSSGMTAKLSLTAALSRSASAVFFDEPWNALDPEARTELTSLLETAAKEFGVPILVSSHELSFVESIADRYAFLQNGKVTASGNLRSLQSAARLNDTSTLLDVYLELVRK